VLSHCFDEKALNARFSDRIEQAWSKWSQKTDLTAFISSLPLAEVPLSASYKKVAPLLAKGQQRLDEVMKPKANNDQSPTPQSRQKRRKPNTTDEASPKPKTAVPTTASKENTNPLAAVEAGIRGMDLLERIRAKEAHKSTLPTPPTKEELARVAALQRAEELLSILDLLAAGKGAGLRVSFPLTALVTSVQSSIRSPMSKEEIENCLAVLEKDVAEGYISCVTFGSMRCVVINKAMKPWPEEVAERLRDCGVIV